jgi:hypothetical protein
MMLTDEERLAVFMALAEKVSKDGFIPAPPWWMAEHPNAHPFWNSLSPENKIGHWISAPDDDYVALVQWLLKRHKETHDNDD